MIEAIAFQTRARTVDHLGREQIADLPTAVSELWKNAYDAYAKNVALHIYDGETPVALVSDDGHGMNKNEFINKWLVVGTESKAIEEKISLSDRGGLPERPRQGQKGIGRLSCANLGPLMLLVSKRKDSEFIASLIDWRLFENPFLILSDIELPIVTFQNKEQLNSLLPSLFDRLATNVLGDNTDSPKNTRILEAWDTYDKLVRKNTDSWGVGNEKFISPSDAITNTIINTAFEERHFDNWPVWSGDSKNGTALFISNLHFDLLVQLQRSVTDTAAIGAKDKFFETLSGFIDPYIKDDDLSSNLIPEFSYEVIAWNKDIPHTIVSAGKEFNRTMVENMEHIIEGIIGSDGTFRGRVKAFGEWRDENVIIEAPKDLSLPDRADTRLGKIRIFIATMEFLEMNTTHPKEEHQNYKNLASKYSGFMMYRDGLRVMPYGRTDNDFFDIEKRRSYNAGTEFWNHRQMFGRLAITRDGNPNLKDKAGREGLLDNRAAKALKDIVSNVLKQSARRFLGRASDYRKELLEGIQSEHKERKAQEELDKLKKKQRKQFRASLRDNLPVLLRSLDELEAYLLTVSFDTQEEVESAQEKLSAFKTLLSTLSVGTVPTTLGTLEESYKIYRSSVQKYQVLISESLERLFAAMDKINPKSHREIAEKTLKRNAAYINQRVNGWKKAIEKIQTEELGRVADLINYRTKLFYAEMTPLLNQIDQNELTLSEALITMEGYRVKFDGENEALLEPYLRALESLRENIDLESLASFGMEEVQGLRQEIERLNSLAQLGICVEVIGHELESYDDMIASGLETLPETVKGTKGVQSIRVGYEGITNQLRFLSPLKLSGTKEQRWITGEEIYQYVNDFFGRTLLKSDVKFVASESFQKMSVFEHPSRIFPVFINLINNSRYWLSVEAQLDRQIMCDVIDGKVVISDNGPGVAKEDISSLFTLFFTKKTRGGRGVGLYLCRANLLAGGHQIFYATDKKLQTLSGANFVIDFKGANYE